MKIVVVDPSSFTAHYDANLCHALAARGHDVTLDTSEFLFERVRPLGAYEVRNRFFGILDDRPALAAAPLARRAVKAAVYPFELARWARTLRRSPPDVVHLQWSLLPFWDSRIFEGIRERGVRFVYTVHDVEPLPGSSWTAMGSSRLYRHADALVAHSEHSRRRLVWDFGLAAERIHVVPLGGPGAFAQSPLPQSEARVRLGLKPDCVYLLFFGLIKRHKGLDLLLEAFALALRERTELRLLVAGMPMQPWRTYARQIDRLGIADALDLHLNYVPSENLPLYFCAADLVVLPYRSTYQSGVVLAAYSFDRPVLATWVGGMREQVDEGITGFLAPPEVNGLARGLIDATADPDTLRSMRSAAGTRVRGLHGWDLIAARHEKIYESIPRS